MEPPTLRRLPKESDALDGHRALVRHFGHEAALAAITLACDGSYVTLRRTYERPETEPSTGFVWAVAHDDGQRDSIGANVWEPDSDPAMACRRVFSTAEAAYDDFLIQLDRWIADDLKAHAAAPPAEAGTYLRPATEAKLVRQVLKRVSASPVASMPAAGPSSCDGRTARR